MSGRVLIAQPTIARMADSVMRPGPLHLYRVHARYRCSLDGP